MKSPSPILIFGAPRSGTTFLREIVNAHPEIFISSETRIFSWLYQAMVRIPDSDSHFINAAPEFQSYARQFAPTIIRKFYDSLAPEASYWGDKDAYLSHPDHLPMLRMTMECFPGTKFIHIIRDGRDVVTSLYQKRYATGERWVKDLDEACGLWLDFVAAGNELKRIAKPGHFLEIRYEELIKDELTTAKKVMNFLGVDMHPAVVTFCKQQTASRTPFSEPTRNIATGVSGSDWNKILTKSQQDRCSDQMEGRLLALGYPATTKSVQTIGGDLGREIGVMIRDRRNIARIGSWVALVGGAILGISLVALLSSVLSARSLNRFDASVIAYFHGMHSRVPHWAYLIYNLTTGTNIRAFAVVICLILVLARRFGGAAALLLTLLLEQAVYFGLSHALSDRSPLQSALSPGYKLTFPADGVLAGVVVFGMISYLIIRRQQAAFMKAVLAAGYICLIALMSLAKIAVGVRLPTDIVVSIALGATILTISVALLEMLSSKTPLEKTPVQAY